MDSESEYPRILTNMAFWQAPTWTRKTTSIYPDLQSLQSFYPSFIEAWKLLQQRRAFDVVVTMGARTSFFYGLLCILFRQESRQIMTEVFIDTPQETFIWRWKTRLFKSISNRCVGILTNSRSEVAAMAHRFKVPQERLRFVPMHSNIQTPKYIGADGKYILSAGRTLRDYSTLLKVTRLVNRPFVIICGRDDDSSTAYPPHVTLVRECTYEVYLQYLQQCHAVILPLQNTERSTGQVALLEAMAYGKPVVATHAPGTVDIIREGINGFTVPVGHAEKMAAVIESLYSNPALYEAIGRQAVKDVRQFHTFEIHARQKLQAIAELYSYYRMHAHA